MIFLFGLYKLIIDFVKANVILTKK